MLKKYFKNKTCSQSDQLLNVTFKLVTRFVTPHVLSFPKASVSSESTRQQNR